jgi:sterol desaturase/sphingolipid hydroxylase (fatty acid hydroxylase superfamily)
MGAAWWALLGVVPTHVSLTLLGHTVETDSAHEHINNAALIFLLLPSALWIEAAVVGWSKSSARQLLISPTASLKTDLACFFLGQAHVLDLVGRLLMLGVSMISGAAIHAWLQSTVGLDLGPPSLPVPVLIPLYFLVYTFFDYWTHRLDHTRFFWPLHRYHHSAEDFGVITAGRQHPAAFTAIFVVNLPLAILGAPAEVMIYVNVLVVGIGFLIHSKIDADWGWVGRWVIQSPNHHRLHHKLDMSHPTGHFAVAPIWDRLFGTWYGDKPTPPWPSASTRPTATACSCRATCCATTCISGSAGSAAAATDRNRT